MILTKYKAYANMLHMTTKTNTQNLERVAILQTSEDLKAALLVVSLAVNLFLFTAWLVIQVDPSYALVLLHTT